MHRGRLAVALTFAFLRVSFCADNAPAKMTHVIAQMGRLATLCGSQRVGIPELGRGLHHGAWGNLTNRNGHAGKTNYEPLNAPAALNNQLTGFGYDAAGNMTSSGQAVPPFAVFKRWAVRDFT